MAGNSYNKNEPRADRCNRFDDFMTVSHSVDSSGRLSILQPVLSTGCVGFCVFCCYFSKKKKHPQKPLTTTQQPPTLPKKN